MQTDPVSFQAHGNGNNCCCNQYPAIVFGSGHTSGWVLFRKQFDIVLPGGGSKEHNDVSTPILLGRPDTETLLVLLWINDMYLLTCRANDRRTHRAHTTRRDSKWSTKRAPKANLLTVRESKSIAVPRCSQTTGAVAAKSQCRKPPTFWQR